LTFNFIGTKIRLISDRHLSIYREGNVQFIIDGVVYNFSQLASQWDPCRLTFEATGLEYGIHSVKIISKTSQVSIDAIDIDDTGNLIDPHTVQSIRLDKTTLNLNVNQSETVTASVYPTDATNKKVNWISSDTTIAKVENGVVTAGGKVGTATITATTLDGSKTATCIVTVSEQNHSNAILTIYLSNQTQRQYDLSSSELNAFLNWYDTRATGTGNVRYGFNKPVASSAFTKRTEYVVYDNIVAFDIDEYISSGK
jgi:uncharacterized protein YjdB